MPLLVNTFVPQDQDLGHTFLKKKHGITVVILRLTYFSVTPLDIESGLCLLFSSVLAVDETRCLKLVRSHLSVK